MDERQRRVGRNEALIRQVNEELEALDQFTRITERTVGIVCECGDLLCQERLDVPVATYERARSESELFLVVPGHEIPAAEDVVERSDRYTIVRKHEGGPAELARETDPRSEGT
jgi:hypothetical protein